MRTTLTLDPDVAETLEGLRKRRKTTFREAVNEALRAGLGLPTNRKPRACLAARPSVNRFIAPRLLKGLATELEDEAVLASMLRH